MIAPSHVVLLLRSIDVIKILNRLQINCLFNSYIRNFQRKVFVVLITTFGVISANAQTAKEELKANIYFSGSNYLDYDHQLATEPLTTAPIGYEPFYMSHYGRHGSRWLIGENEYIEPMNTLRQARQAGKLTTEGKITLKKLEDFYPTTINRLGELTVVGERQHHGIGRRMAQNFPEIFKTKNVLIDARSTVVIRCILSMEAECEELAAANPMAQFHNDVSESFQYYLNQNWSERLKRNASENDAIYKVYEKKMTHPNRLMKVLFNDHQWAFDNIRATSLMHQLFKLANNMQSHDTDIELYSLFTDEEIYDLWRLYNIGWYLDYGAAPQNGSIMPFSQLNLLKNIIETADTVTHTQATLRFGHEVCVLPLACLLELGQCGAKVENLDTLDNVWRNYKIFPMACNIQLVFYRPKEGKAGDILVKALLNERETTLPVQPVKLPYYRWNDLRQYYLNKIAEFESDSSHVLLPRDTNSNNLEVFYIALLLPILILLLIYILKVHYH